MNWTTVGDVRARLQRRWDKGDLLRPLVTGDGAWPLRVPVKGPSSAEVAEQFEAVRGWIAQLTGAARMRIESTEVRHRVLGPQRLPESIWVDTLDDAAALLGTVRELNAFRAVLETTRGTEPRLLPWLAARPLLAAELVADWTQILAVVGWRARRGRPGIYLRQVDLPGVHTKFVEQYRAVIGELLDLVLDPSEIDARFSSTRGFEARYGFLPKPLRLRFRVLDPELATLPGVRAPDLQLDAASFASLALPVERVFITENEINFLAFPAAPRALALFGAGYGWDTVSRAPWLARCDLHYWGDIDTHGFSILDQLRAHLPHVRSFLMDRETLLAHEALWGEEPDQETRDLPRLTESEGALYDDLRFNRLRPRLRFEQERVGFAWAAAEFHRRGVPSAAEASDPVRA